ncbi:MAG: hypothetical protein KDA78_18475, partial [Planctomycetaceae bacterium]|nr:hypothetical protein [Planctomycetaceae bacterium]
GTKMLAARAYLKASYILSDGNESAAAQYRKFAEKAIRLQEGRTIQEIEIEFKQEIAQGDQLIQQIADDEQRWIEEGRNLDEEFAVKYLNLPPMQINKADYIPITYNRVQRTIDRNPQWMLSAVAVLSMILFLLYLHRKINKNSDPQQPQPLR